MAKSPTEQIAELRKEISELREANAVLLTRLELFLKDFENLQTERKAEAAERQENARLRQEVAETRKVLEDERAIGRTREEKFLDLQKNNAALEARGDEHGKQIEHLTTRVWGLIALLLVAALGFIGYSLRK